MWLLTTDRAELRFFAGPESVPDGGYAILSHVWVPGEEQTFQDLQAIHARCAETGENPRDLACAKIRECCMLAERHGYRWLWLDTCCIDKTSSSELSEAINSMFRYYALAEVCYAYLRDVPGGCSPEAQQRAFKNSKWHTRGWTLQELIAPVHVLFLANDWTSFGDKWVLAKALEAITGITARVLRFDITLDSLSVAHRMHWAAPRVTTRLEDEAYCLMGIFGIHMPTLYGEGRQAFRRLQEEIMKYSVDTSLLVWGSYKLNQPPHYLGIQEPVLPENYALALAPSAFHAWKWVFHLPHRPDQKAFAKACLHSRRTAETTRDPTAYQPFGAKQPLAGHGRRRYGPRDNELEHSKGMTSMSMTPFGVSMRRIPIIRMPQWTVAMLSCFICMGPPSQKRRGSYKVGKNQGSSNGLRSIISPL